MNGSQTRSNQLIDIFCRFDKNTNAKIIYLRLQADWIYATDDSVECTTQEVVKVRLLII